MAGGDVRSAHSAVPCEAGAAPPAVFHSLLAAGSGAPNVSASLTAAQLWPRPAGPHWVWQWNTSACAVKGAAASACAFPLPQGQSGEAGPRPLPSPRSSDAVPWTLWSVAPQRPSGYTLLGETAK